MKTENKCFIATIVIGILASVLGVFSSLFVYACADFSSNSSLASQTVVYSGFLNIFNIPQTIAYYFFSIAGFVFSIVGLVFSCISKKHKFAVVSLMVFGVIMMLSCAVMQFIPFYVFSGLLFFVAGLVGYLPKRKKKVEMKQIEEEKEEEQEQESLNENASG